MSLSADDRAEILEVISRFGIVHDNRRADWLEHVFSADAEIDYSYAGGPSRPFGLEYYGKILAGMRKSGFRADHQTTDTVLVVSADADGQVHARSRYVVIRPDGPPSNGEILDVLKRTPAGWRISKRKMYRRWPELEIGWPPPEFFAGWPFSDGGVSAE